MFLRPTIESLEPRQLFSGGPFDPHGLEQAETAFANVNASALQASPVQTTAMNVIGLQTATTSATHYMSLGIELGTNPQSPPPVSSNRPMMVAPNLLNGAGGVVIAQPPANVHTSDRSAEPDAAGGGSSTPLNLSDGASASHAPAPQPADEAHNQDAGSLSRAPVSGPRQVLDLCFADDDWAPPVEDALTSGSDKVEGSCGLDLVVAAVGMAASVHFATNDLETRARAAYPSRRQFGRPDRG